MISTAAVLFLQKGKKKGIHIFVCPYICPLPSVSVFFCIYEMGRRGSKMVNFIFPSSKTDFMFWLMCPYYMIEYKLYLVVYIFVGKCFPKWNFAFPVWTWRRNTSCCWISWLRTIFVINFITGTVFVWHCSFLFILVFFLLCVLIGVCFPRIRCALWGLTKRPNTFFLWTS